MSDRNNTNGGDWGSWIPIIILFCVPTPVTWIIAFVWLVSKLRGGGLNRRGNVKRHPYDIQREQARQNMEWEQVDWQDGGAGGNGQWQAPGPQQGQNQAQAKAAEREHRKSERQERRDTRRQERAGARADAGGAGTEPSARKKAKSPGKAPGRTLMISGAGTAAVFLLAVVTFIAEALQGASLDLTGVLPCFVFLAGGLGALGAGISMNRKAERFANYLGYIGANREVDLARMAVSFDVPVGKLCRDLRQMLAKGYLPTGYLDLAEGKLFLTEMGYRPPEPKKPEPPKEEPKAIEKEDDILREIRQVNGDIPDEVMSVKIDRIEEITRKILAYQKKHPDKEGQLRTFLNYYLPTTLKILRAYAQLEAQGIEGENISAAKGRIEGMMDQVVAGFEKQLDKLFQDDALDIASDVQVLENMLKKDGLSDGTGVTLGL